MPKAKSSKARLKDMLDTFLEDAAELWKKNQDRFMTVLEESESKKVKVNFAVSLDFSESSAVLGTAMRFSEVFTDERSHTFEDPNQEQIPGTAPEDLKAEKKGRAKSGGE